MGRGRRIAAVASSLAIVGLLSACDPQQPWRSELVSANAEGTDGGVRGSDTPVFSPDGTRIAFASNASDLGPRDTNGATDVYVRDLGTGTTSLVSVRADGADGGDDESEGPVFSPDGTKIAFTSTASDLGPRDTNDRADVYVRDLAAGTTALVSVNSAGTDSGSVPPGGVRYGGVRPVFSPDGSKIAFYSAATDLTPLDTDAEPDLFVRDLTAGTTGLVSVDAAGTGSAGVGPSGFGEPVAFSPDGTKVAFTSPAANLVPLPDGNRATDVFVRDLVAGTTSLVSADTSGGASGNGRSWEVGGFTTGGTGVVFVSRAANLVPADANGTDDVFVRDLATGTTTLVSARAGADGSADGASLAPVVSPDGTRVAFWSRATDLGAPDPDRWPDIYVRDLAGGTTTLVSADEDGTGTGADGEPVHPQFSQDGSRVAFVSRATDLGPRSNGLDQVYVRDLATGTTTMVSANAEGTDGGNRHSGDRFYSDVFENAGIAFDPGGGRVAFVSEATDLGPTDRGDYPDVYVATLYGADLAAALDASPEPVAAGAELTYELTVTNAGPDGAQNANAALLLPEGVTFAAVTSGGADCTEPPAEHPGLVTCALGDLGSGATAAVTVTATVGAAPDARVAALALAGSDTLDPAGANNGATAESTVVAAP